MSLICPTVTAYDINSFNQQIELVSSFASRIHIDLMDGIFTTTKSPEIADICIPDNLVVDIHVMYQNPVDILDYLIKLKPNLVIMHAESDADIPYLASVFRQQQILSGVALLADTQVKSCEYILPHVQHGLIFSGKLGFHGGQADLNQLNKAGELKKLNRYLEIGWDGGATSHNCQNIASNGVDVINVGSAIHRSDNPAMSYELLNKLSAI